MSKRWMGMAAVLVAVGMPSMASAADVRTGAQVDPADDATAAKSLYSDTTTRLLDVRAVRVSYDSGAGALELSFDGQLDGIGHSTLSLHAELSEPSDNGCTGSQSRAFVVEGVESGRGYSTAVPTARLLDADGALVATGTYEDASQTGTGPRLSFVTPKLAGRDLRCVDAVSASKAASGYASMSRDDVDPFCLGACPGPVVAPQQTPASTDPVTVSQAPVPPAAPAPPAPVAGTEQSTSVEAPVATLATGDARIAAVKALGARFGKAFERRAPGSYRLVCTASGSTGACTVRWRTGGVRYAGSVALEARLAGATTSVAVTRVSVHRI